MSTILENRHHADRVPVYASSHFSFQNDDYRRSLRKIESLDRKKTLASVNKRLKGEQAKRTAMLAVGHRRQIVIYSSMFLLDMSKSNTINA